MHAESPTPRPHTVQEVGLSSEIAAADLDSPQPLIYRDLRGTDLRRRRIRYCSLAGTQLDEADLSEATLISVSLDHASLTGAKLTGAKLLSVDASGADFTGTDLSESYWSVCDLSDAHLANASLQDAFLTGCSLARAQLDRSDLTSTRLIDSYATEASFRATVLSRISTTGAKFTGADFTGASGFFRSREIVAEVLRQGIGEDWELSGLVGSVLFAPTWCYPEWQAWLHDHPERLSVARAIFAGYPDSGCTEALLGAVPADEAP